MGLSRRARVLVAAVALPFPGLVAADDAFAVRCRQAAGEARIEAVFADRPVDRDDSRSIDDLKTLAGSGANPARRILGLTHAEPTARTEYAATFLKSEDGRICAVPSLTVHLGFSQFQVFIAREVADPCRQRIIYEHELEHVATWRAHLRAGARLLTTVLQQDLGGAHEFPDRPTAEAGLRRQASQRVAQWLQQLKDAATLAQQQIDSPQSYRDVEHRLATCP